MKELAAKYHTGQIWEGEVKRPYIVHPQGVVQKLLDWGELPSSTAIPMAWGHDLLEDTTVSEAEILAASNEVVLAGIKLLTKPQNMEKPLYLQRVADMASREILLVKTADRLFNSRSFATLRGVRCAFCYLHDADCLLPALQKIQEDPVVQNALTEWKNWNDSLYEEARKDAIRGCLLGGSNRKRSHYLRNMVQLAQVCRTIAPGFARSIKMSMPVRWN